MIGDDKPDEQEDQSQIGKGQPGKVNQERIVRWREDRTKPGEA
jgi:hypothetical protein